jgi:hypothetical protein
MSGYLAIRLYYWIALLLVLALLWVAYQALIKLLPAEHPIKKYLLSQTSGGTFSLAQKVAACLMLLCLLGVLVFYG